MRLGLLGVIAFAGLIGCGGPASVDPGPTQSVQDDFAGTDDTGALHVHVDFIQNGRNITLKSPCDPQDYCRIYPYNATGQAELGSQFAVDIISATGTLLDPGITFTMTTANGKTFNFSGNVIQSKRMIGTLSGPSHPASRLQLDLQ
jgi:hypothetical protein